jgi:acyl-CoA thioesterase II
MDTKGRIADSLPELLRLTEVGPHTYRVFQPSDSAEGRDVVFSGQLSVR